MSAHSMHQKAERVLIPTGAYGWLSYDPTTHMATIVGESGVSNEIVIGHVDRLLSELVTRTAKPHMMTVTIPPLPKVTKDGWKLGEGWSTELREPQKAEVVGFRCRVHTVCT